MSTTHLLSSKYYTFINVEKEFDLSESDNLVKSLAQVSKSFESLNWIFDSIPSMVKKCFSIRLINGIGNSRYTTFFSATTTSL